MAVRLVASQIQNLQQIEALVTQPEGPSRLLNITGVANCGFGAYSQGGVVTAANQTFTILLGPVLTRQQFFRAIANASLALTGVGIQVIPANPMQLGIVSSDADWDDESGQVELRVEVTATAIGANNSARIDAFSFHVIILAAAG